MRKFTLSIVFLSFTLAGFATTWTVVNVGDSFSPATLTIVSGDDVDFNLEAFHNSVEVSEATWNANGTAPLAGGWSLPLGGGTVPASMLEVGTHYYVCQPHAGLGMKGIIIVQSTTSTDDQSSASSFSFYPNPSPGKIRLVTSSDASQQEARLEIFDIHGNRIYNNSRLTQEELQIELSTAPKGIYIIRLYDNKGIHSRKLILQ